MHGKLSGDNFGFDAGVSFSENCALGMAETISSTVFSAYPNPTTGLVHFSKPVNMVLYTITGQKIADKQHTDSFDLSGQPNGVYLMALSDDSANTLTRKIVKL